MTAAASSFTAVTAGAVRWEVLPEITDHLLGPDGLRLEEWLQSGQAKVVKHGPHRTVYRVTLPGLDFFLKHYRLHDTRAWLRELVRPSKARMECEQALTVAAAGVATVEPLALGECRRRWGPDDSFLVTRTLDGALPLDRYLETAFPHLPPKRQARTRQHLAEAMGEFLARLHDAGIVHNDLHAGNIMVRLDADDRPTLYLIDLHALTVRAPLDWNASRDNLVMLNRWFILRSNRADRLRCWRAYQRHRQFGIIPTEEQARDLERRTQRSNWHFWAARDRRCLATNRYYYPVRSAAAEGWAVRDLDAAFLAALLADPDRPFREPGVRLLKDSRSSTVMEVEVPGEHGPRRAIWKRFRATSWTDPWAALVRPTATLRSWVFGQGLRERLLPTPRPLLVLHRRKHGLWTDGYLLCEKVADAVDLHEFVAGLEPLTEPERRSRLRCAIDQVAALVRDLHLRGISQRDLKATNLLVQRRASDNSVRSTPWRFWFIDLVGLSNHRRVSRRRRVQNLARLHASFAGSSLISRTDKLRFLRVYLQWGLHGCESWRTWWAQVDQATRAKQTRNARVGRVLT